MMLKSIMRRLIILFLIAWPFQALFAQALNNINFRDLYNPDAEVSIILQPVKTQKIEVYYKIRTTTLPLDNYTIAWEKRESFTQKEGSPITITDTLKTSDKIKEGVVSVDPPDKPWLLVVKVTNKETQKSWVSFKKIEANYPVSGWVEEGNDRLTKKYLITGQSYVVKTNDNRPYFVSYFNEEFPAAYPPFAETESKADRFLFHDSTFQIAAGSSFSITKTGLYLFQKDTAAAEGIAFRVVNKIYPKFSKIEDLIKPLIFVCTQEEYAELQNSKGDKAKFDKVILDITRDKERASNFMRSYFRRVELSNQYFISYKDGWKTDRGMIYLIFGLPDEVSYNDGTETWYYKTSKSRFSFVKSGSVYDPDNYILIRDKRFMETWFATIDLWRKSRD
jgi:GWxTD domain-containing protein